MKPFSYDSPEWRALRQQARRRDGNRCRRCGARGKLIVNHLKTVRDFPHLALDLANVETLCAACDNKHHREKGHGMQAWGCDAEGRPFDPTHPWNQARER